MGRGACSAPRPAMPPWPIPPSTSKATCRVSNEAAAYRETHRLSEDEFIRMSREPGTIVLDARSQQKYDELHVKGAVNLSFPDIAIESLQRAFPDKNARILDLLQQQLQQRQHARSPRRHRARRSTSRRTSRSMATVTGMSFELGPLIDVDAAKLEFQSGRNDEQNGGFRGRHVEYPGSTRAVAGITARPECRCIGRSCKTMGKRILVIKGHPDPRFRRHRADPRDADRNGWTAAMPTRASAGSPSWPSSAATAP